MNYISACVAWESGQPREPLARMFGSVSSHAGPFDSLVEGPAALGTATDPGRHPTIRSACGDGEVFLVADCRLDDIEDLRAALGAPSGVTDVELLLLGYRRWGIDLPQHLFGDYAFILWDSIRHALFASRDPFGIKQLVYARTDSSLYVAGDVEMILGTSAVSLELSEDAVVNYLGWSTSRDDRTFFRDVFKLPGGHSLVAERKSFRLLRHWHPPKTALRLNNREEYHEEFRRLFARAVKTRMRGSTVIQVSGGLDSSCIATVASRLVEDGELAERSVRGAAALHPGLPCDEQTYIEAVASHAKFPIDTWDGTQSLDLDLVAPDIAAPSSRTVLTGGTQGDVEIAKRSGAEALLNGSGGDQLGMPTGVLTDLVARLKWMEAFRHIFLVPGATLPRGLTRVRGVLSNLLPDTLRPLLRRLRRKPTPAPWLMSIGTATRSGVLDSSIVPVSHYSYVEKRHWEDLSTGRLPSSVDDFQRHSYRNGLESRFPFLDRALTTFVLSIPFDNWPPPKTDERLHRHAMAQLLPPVIAKRRSKALFTSALARRVERNLPLIRDLFGGSEWLAGQFVDQAGARKLLAKVDDSSRGTHGFFDWHGLWSIATLEAWLRAIKRYSAQPRLEGEAHAG
jgi:asparagine synthase (glutamine-hydrolysing)